MAIDAVVNLLDTAPLFLAISDQRKPGETWSATTITSL
jgi:hypothetical protein